MGAVTISINGRDYDVACDDGQESAVESLAQNLNNRIKELAGHLNGVGEVKLLVLTLLTIASEMEDLKAENQRLKVMNRGKEAAESEQKLAGVIDQLANRIENMALSLDASSVN